MGTEYSDQKKKASRKRILKAATELFGRKGYHGTTVDDITRAANLSRGALYWHFKGKSHLLEAVFQRIETEYLDRFIRETTTAGPSPMEKLWYIFKFNSRFAVEHANLIHCLRTLSLELTPSDDNHAQILHDILNKQHAFIAGIIKEGQESGFLRKDFKADIMTAIILAVHDGIVLQLSMFKHFLDARDATWAFKQITLAGMSADAKIVQGQQSAPKNGEEHGKEK